jgi:hypothetical protein
LSAGLEVPAAGVVLFAPKSEVAGAAEGVEAPPPKRPPEDVAGVAEPDPKSPEPAGFEALLLAAPPNRLPAGDAAAPPAPPELALWKEKLGAPPALAVPNRPPDAGAVEVVLPEEAPDVLDVPKLKDILAAVVAAQAQAVKARRETVRFGQATRSRK